jgi:glycosyltransferase involved in cell wall biosynthesis
MPAVSVIIAAYDVEPYVADAIDSARAQTVRDLEIVVVDDGSTDRTRAVAESRAAADPRVRVHHQPNGGISAARNCALRLASGAVLAILDSDDRWDPTYLDAQLAILDRRPEIDVVTANGWFHGGTAHGQPVRPWPDPRPEPDLAHILGDENAVFIMSIFRRRVYETIGGFDESLRTNEDYDFWIRAAAAGFRFARNDRPLGYYRRRDGSLSANDLRMIRGILRVYEKARRALEGRPRERAILDAQVARFETERLAAEARHAIEVRDFTSAARHLAALQIRRGGAAIGVARLMARWTPGLLARAYHFRRARQQRVVKVRRRTETGEAPRRQAGAPTTRFLRGGVEGATTENTGSM